MFGKLGDMMGKIQEMKRIAEETKKKLEEMTVRVDSGDGGVKVEVTGSRKIKMFELSEDAVKLPKDALQQKITETLNRALDEANKISENEMKKIAGGLLPGLSI